jgi:hemerythrin-like domain-containing protein
VRFLDELRAEHWRIDALLGSLCTYAGRRARGEAGPGDAGAFLRFFQLFAGRYHHAREEQILLPALVERVQLPPARGPIPSLLQQHRDIAVLLDEVAALLPLERLTAEQGAALTGAATRYAHALWRHIDAENSVLLPESEARLTRAGVLELPDRPIGSEELEAREGASALLARYPPDPDRTAVRGEGCVVCPSYGTSCDGVEREWWTDDEWDDFFHRVG